MKSSFLGMSLINLRELYGVKRIGQEVFSGGYGSYYKLDDHVGVKVLQASTNCTSMREAAEIEAKNGKAAEACGFTPKYYGAVEVVLPSGKHEWGILMEHIEGVRLGDYMGHRYDRYTSSYDKTNKIGSLMRKLLSASTGIYHRDTHSNNIILKKVGSKIKLYLIDFSVECSYPEKAGTNIPDREK